MMRWSCELPSGSITLQLKERSRLNAAMPCLATISYILYGRLARAQKARRPKLTNNRNMRLPPRVSNRSKIAVMNPWMITKIVPHGDHRRAKYCAEQSPRPMSCCLSRATSLLAVSRSWYSDPSTGCERTCSRSFARRRATTMELGPSPAAMCAMSVKLSTTKIAPTRLRSPSMFEAAATASDSCAFMIARMLPKSDRYSAILIQC
mmetsp:Transcript_32615/g.86006  ORF Transcript_32615/g.86006 Transcript_32615/m.86006 type:complete len:206 (+) Transcript_32615:2508-3125(+)